MYRLNKSKSIFFHTLKLFRKKKKKLSLSARAEIHETLNTFQNSLSEKNIEASFNLAKKCELLTKLHMKKHFFDHVVELVFALIFALIVATVVRQMWFELYEIPSGSMRPTLLENDRLVVSKNQFCINVPLMLKHFLFEPEEVKRNGVFIFSGENMDIPNNHYNYFYIFPGYKQYVKRLMGKPGDTLYFYGGQIYGMDRDGNDITDLLQPKSLSHISHVPFINFEGDIKTPSPLTKGISSPVIFYQMNLPIAKLFASSFNQVKGEILYTAERSEKPVADYGDLWGFKNYGMAQILHEDNNYILELTHSPSIKHTVIKKDYYGKFIPMLGTSKSYIQLNDALLKKIFQSLYTDRFVVKDGYMRRSSQVSPPIQKGVKNYYPYLDGIPNGTYEFFDGKGYQVYWQGVRRELPANHPLMQYTPEKATLFFNIGMEFDTRFLPDSLYDVLPARYAFFNHNALYLMGHEVISHDDPDMVKYVNRELERERESNGNYVPFIDYGPPLTKEGKLDKDFIRQAGLKIPEGHYLALGDNYAMSADSRKFGFVPQENIRGVPDFIFWPVGSQFGLVNQPLYPLFTVSRLIIWGIAGVVFIIWAIVSRRRHALPIKIPE
ncbi:MAG: signal peptidase I [Simkaniaceae bacterium]|nr:signal peptidase I [Simkaniaceae bacterium]